MVLHKHWILLPIAIDSEVNGMLKGKLPIIIAVILGLAAGLLAFSALRKREREIKEGWNLIPVIVANRDIPEGTLIARKTFDHFFAKRDVPEQYVTTNVFRPHDRSQIMGQRLTVAVRRGEPIYARHFMAESKRRLLAEMIEKDYRAITINVKGTTAVGDQVRPADRVDILGTFRNPLMKNKLTTMTILQNTMVLSVGGKTAGDLSRGTRAGGGYVTLMVTPEQAEILVMAQDIGKLNLTLRNPTDDSELKETGYVTIDTFFSGERTFAKSHRVKKDRGVTIIRGKGNLRVP